MVDGVDAVNGRRKLPFFRRSAPDRPIARRRASTVHWHRIVRSLLYLLAWIFVVLVVIGNVADKPVLRNTYFLYLDLSNIIPLSVPNAVLINSIARSIGLHDFYQVGLWNFCEGYNDEGLTKCTRPESLYAFNPVKIILSELLSGASSTFSPSVSHSISTLNTNPHITLVIVALPSDITKPLNLAKVVSHWMFGLFIAAAVLNFVMIFLSPFAVSSRPPQSVKAWVRANSDGTHITPAGQPPHRRRTFIFLRALPMLILAFFTALVTIVASAVATVMFEIFAHVFTKADPSLNIKAHVGVQMLAFMWIGSGFSFIAFIIQIGSCCAACCGGHRARKQLKAQGINLHEKGSFEGSTPETPAGQYAMSEPHAVTRD